MHTKKEAMALGIPLASPKNDKLRRAPWHDYRLPGLYMLTLVVKGRQRVLGELLISPVCKVDLSPLGQKILTDEFQKISQVYTNVKVWKTCIMPDHIHMLVEVTEEFPEKKHLGAVVAGFKTGCNKAYRQAFGLSEGTMWEPKYNDRIILPGMQCETWKHYMEDNPRRLAYKRLYPEFFTTRYKKNICGKECNVFGNLFLLDIPDKVAVIVHTRDSEIEYAQKFRAWMACGERGGVLVGAFVAPREKAVLAEASARGYKLIQLCDNGFGPYHKPCGEAFDACAQGRLLQVSLWDYRADHKKITRPECLALNALATAVAAAL